MAQNLTAYEQVQKSNSVTQWLHSFRYRNALDVMQRVKATPAKVVEIGCGLTTLFSTINPRFAIDYTGIDMDAEHIGIARERNGHHKNFRAIAADAVTALDDIKSADIVFALEALEHFPLNDAVKVVDKIAELRPQIFICSVPVEIGPAIWFKNIGSWLCGYPRHTSYTWSETFWAGLYNYDRVGEHLTGHRGFDWRWLAQTIRNRMRIEGDPQIPDRFHAGCAEYLGVHGVRAALGLGVVRQRVDGTIARRLIGLTAKENYVIPACAGPQPVCAHC